MERETIEQIDARVYDMTEIQTDDISLIKTHVIDERQNLKIFEPFCGTGRIGIPLIRDGHEYCGMDISPETLQRFRMKLEGDRVDRSRCALLEGNVLREEWPANNDVVILGGNCFYTLSSAMDQQLCVTKAFECLEPGGTVFIDSDHMEGPLSDAWKNLDSVRRKTVEGIDEDGSKLVTFCEVVSSDSAQRITTFRYTLLCVAKDGSSYGKQFLWQKHPVKMLEVESWIEEAGFHIEYTFGNHQGNPYSEDSDKAIFIAHKS